MRQGGRQSKQSNRSEQADPEDAASGELPIRPSALRSFSSPLFRPAVASSNNHPSNPTPVGSQSDMAMITLNAYSPMQEMLGSNLPDYSGTEDVNMFTDGGYPTVPTSAENLAYMDHPMSQYDNPWTMQASARAQYANYASQLSGASSSHPNSAADDASSYNFHQQGVLIKMEEIESDSMRLGMPSVVPSSVSPNPSHGYRLSSSSYQVETLDTVDPRDHASRAQSPSTSSSTEGSVGSQAVSASPPETSVPRRKRQYATAQTGQYRCDKCNTYFARSYNLRSHMKTHTPNRPRSFPCQWDGCTTAFERQADLTRHQNSVHLKDRKFKCSRCGHGFTRKDTCRRHEEDGCSMRAEYPQRLQGDSSIKRETSPDPDMHEHAADDSCQDGWGVT